MAIGPDHEQGRVAIVTGAAQGTGRATVGRLADLGYAVVVNYLHEQRTAEAVVDAVLDDRGAAVAVRADVSDLLDVERLFGQTIEMYGAVDVLVHAVLGHVAPAPLTALGTEDFERLCRTTVRATFFVNQMAARRLRDGGAIVNLISTVDRTDLPDHGGVAATAAAVGALTEALALELRDRGITVNGVALDVGRTGPPGRVADLVAYLVGQQGRGITGHVIRLDDRPSSGLDMGVPRAR